MPQYKVMIARLAVNGNHRQEVADFLMVANQVARDHPLVDDGGILHLPINQVPTDCARNRAVKNAQLKKVDLLFMIDDDMAPNLDFFKRALEFLTSQKDPSVLGSPYVSGAPLEKVLVFDWQSEESDTLDTPFKSRNVPREDATRRSGFERVSNIGTGCIAYDLRVFNKISVPYYAYGYQDESHTVVNETEECYCHRRLFAAQVPIFVDWESWAGHWKPKRCFKPTKVQPLDIGEIYMAHARAEAKAEVAQKQEQTPSHQEQYNKACTEVKPRIRLSPKAEGFTPAQAAEWAQSIPGWMSYEELRWLAENARDLPPQAHWLEVGSWKGRSLAAVILCAPPGTMVYAVDTFKGSPNEGVHDEARSKPGSVKRDFVTNISEALRLREGAVIVSDYESTSIAAAEQMRLVDGRFNVIFLDASHEYADVKADLDAWIPLLSEHGLICGHDRFAPGVKKALGETWKDYYSYIVDEPGSIWTAPSLFFSYGESNGKVEGSGAAEPDKSPSV